MIVCLLELVIAHLFVTVLRWRVLVESSGTDVLHFGVVSPMSDHFVRVRTLIVTFDTVEVRRLGARAGVYVYKWTIGLATAHRTAVLFKVATHQRI